MLSLRIFTSQLTVLKRKKITVPRWSWQVETLMLWWSQREWPHRPACLNIWFPAGESLCERLGGVAFLGKMCLWWVGLETAKSFHQPKPHEIIFLLFFPPDSSLLFSFSLYSLFSSLPLSFFYNFHLSFPFHHSIFVPLFLTYYSFFMVCSPPFLSTIGDWYI